MGPDSQEMLPRRTRRVVILADLVESVRLMQQHEADVIDRWRRFRSQLLESVLPALGGRMVRTAGDGLLMDADTVPSGLAMAFALHRALPGYNHEREPSAWMQLRIGIHVADVVVEAHDLQGAGANLAARLATLGQPGDTIVSTEVRQGAVDGIDADFTDFGMRYVKGLSEPVRAFLAQRLGASRSGTRGQGERVPLPDQADLLPTIAVVPFECIPAAPEAIAIGHALADELVGTLVRHPGVKVLARASTSAMAGLDPASAPIQAVLGEAAFVLTGRCYPRGKHARVGVHLTEAKGGQVLWSDTANLDIDALFSGEDDLVQHIVANVTHHVAAHELRRVRSLPMTSLAPYSLFLGASGLMHSLVRNDFEQARRAFEHLVDRYPRQGAAHAMLARWFLYRVAQGWVTSFDEDRAVANEMVQRAMDLDGGDPGTLVAHGAINRFFNHDDEGALRSFERALQLDPQRPEAWARLSEVQTQVGRPTEALSSARKAISLSPLDPSLFLFEAYASRAALYGGLHADAAAHARSSLRRHLLHAQTHRFLVVALWLDGQSGEAREAARRYLQVVPHARVAATRPGAPGGSTTPRWFAAALSEAGVPA